jgi:hypothetical protein
MIKQLELLIDLALINSLRRIGITAVLSNFEEDQNVQMWVMTKQDWKSVTELLPWGGLSLPTAYAQADVRTRQRIPRDFLQY